MKKFLLLVLVIIVGLGLFKNLILKTVVSTVGSKVVGAPISLDSMAVGIFKPSVRINGFKLYNPEGFSKNTLIDLPKVRVDYDLPAVFKGKLHFSKVDVELKEVGLERNKDKELNVEALKVVQEAKKPSQKPAAEKTPPKDQPAAKQLAMQIDELNVKMDRVVYRDYSKGGAEPQLQVFSVGLNKQYKNITSAQQLSLLLMSEGMKGAGMQAAGVYGAAMLAGTAVLPVAAGAALIGKDHAQQDFAASYDAVYKTALDVVKQSGTLKSENKDTGVIEAVVSGADVTVKCVKSSAKSVQVTASARKLMLPRPEVAGGILYKMAEKLK